MRKFNLVLFLLMVIFPLNGMAAAPTRTYSYAPHTTIDSNQNNTNENALYSYLQAGVDTYSTASITNDAISSSAAISYSKLNLIGNIKNSDISTSAAIVGSKLDLTSPGVIGNVTPSTGGFTDLVASGTIRFGSTHQGDVFYDNGTSIVRLTPGTSGLFLETQGVSANPIWASTGPTPGMVLVSNTAISGATNTGDIAITSTGYYKIVVQLGNLSAGDTLLLRFNNDSSGSLNYQYAYNGRTSGGALTGGSGGANAITIGTQMNNSASAYWQGEFNINPFINSTVNYAFGKMSYQDKAGSLFSFVDFMGYWGAGPATSFRLLTSSGSTMSGNVLLYKLTTS